MSCSAAEYWCVWGERHRVCQGHVVEVAGNHKSPWMRAQVPCDVLPEVHNSGSQRHDDLIRVGDGDGVNY
eukprot:6488681-Amphidinium_carterae.1